MAWHSTCKVVTAKATTLVDARGSRRRLDDGYAIDSERASTLVDLEDKPPSRKEGQPDD